MIISTRESEIAAQVMMVGVSEKIKKHAAKITTSKTKTIKFIMRLLHTVFKRSITITPTSANKKSLIKSGEILWRVRERDAIKPSSSVRVATVSCAAPMLKKMHSMMS